MSDLDRPMVSFLKNLDLTKLPDGTEKITLHKALTISSGLNLTQEELSKLKESPAALKGQKQVLGISLT